MRAAGSRAVRPASVGRYLILVLILVGIGAVGSVAQKASADTPINGVDLSRYALTGRFDLPTPATQTPPDPFSLLSLEASSVTYDWDTNTLFEVGDGGTSVVQVTKTGGYINSMTLAPGGSPQGTTFYDTEAITYVGNGQFVLGEERDRQVNLFTYAANGILTRADVQTVKLGTTIGNIGIEGISYDPQTTTAGSPGFIVAKEMQPEGIFQTNIDFAAGTATNGSPTTDESTNLFDPPLAGLQDFSDVFALSNLPNLSGPQTGNLLIVSQQSGKIENVDRNGKVDSWLAIRDPGSTLSVPDETHEGITMDRDGNIYTVSEDGGGPSVPQLWVYSPTAQTDLPPTAVTLSNELTSIPENTATTDPVKLADVSVTDDDGVAPFQDHGIGEDQLSVSGPDASDFQVDETGLYLKAGVTLNAATKSTYHVTVDVDDATVGASPDASTDFTLTVAPSVSEPSVVVTEVAPWGSGNAPYAADWFELTNTGSTTVDLTGWRMDDSHDLAEAAVPLDGVPSLPAGKSAVFIEDTDATSDADLEAAFAQTWFGTSTLPSGFLVGFYGGSSVGLSTGGDAVNIFDSFGNPVTGVSFGTSLSTSPFASFDNTAAGTTVSTLSQVGVNGAFLSADGHELGSPGTAATAPPPPPSVAITEVAPWGSSEDYAADWFELTNTGSTAVDLTGWTMDDSSDSFATSVALHGVSSLPAGESAVFFEDTSGTDATIESKFLTDWTGSSTVPAGFLVGFYGGSGVGLSSGGDGVNVFDASGDHMAGVSFGAAATGSPLATFDNTAGGSGTISTLSVNGVNGAFVSANGLELGSPGSLTPPPAPVAITEVAPWGSSASYAADWFEVTNTSSSPIDLTGWKMDDSSDAFATAVALHGVSSLAPGASAVFLEDTGGSDATIEAAFSRAWLGTSTPPAGLLIGLYGGSGVGLSTSGDGVNLFDSTGKHVTGVSFAASTTNVTFDNAAGLTGTISTLSSEGSNGAFAALSADGEIGSPGTTRAPHTVISEVAPFGSSASYGADWFEVTDTGTLPLDLTGWEMDDSSDALSSAVAIHGLTEIPAGRSAVFFEDTGGLVDSTIVSEFLTAWTGSTTVPAGFLTGFYGGSGVGLSTGGDAVNLFDGAGNHITGVTFGSSPSTPPLATFDNTAGLSGAISRPSVIGTNGAFLSNDDQEIGSPFAVNDATPPTIVHTATPAANGNGWNNSTVTVSFTCTDSGLGVDEAASSLGDVVLTASGMATAICVDRAGNRATATFPVMIDETAPSVALTGDAGTYTPFQTVSIQCSATDPSPGSGIDPSATSCASIDEPAYSFGPGPHTITATATDLAGNSTSQSTTFTVVSSTSGTADGAGLQLPGGAHADFHVDAHNGNPTGTLTFDGPPPPPPTPPPKGGKPGPPAPPVPPFHYAAKTITAFGISDDGTTVWFEGVGQDGSTFVVYAEDHGKPGPGGPGPGPGGAKNDPDVFELWIDGVLQTPADGSLAGGDVNITVPKAPPPPPLPPPPAPRH